MCSYRSAISAYHEAIGSFTVGKHALVTNLMPEIFKNRLPQPHYTFIWYVKTVTVLFDTLNLNKIEIADVYINHAFTSDRVC